MKLFLEKNDYAVPLLRRVLDHSTRLGLLDIVEHVYGELKRRPSDSSTADGAQVESCIPMAAEEYAARCEHVAVLSFVLSHEQTLRGPELDCVVKPAILKRDLQLVKLLHERGVTFPVETMTWVGMAGSLPIAQFLNDSHGKDCLYYDGSRDAAAYGYLPVVQLFTETHSEWWPGDAMEAAASNGQLVILKYLISCHPEACSVQVVRQAIHYGQLEIVKYLLHDCSREIHATAAECMQMACNFGQFAIVKWLDDSGTWRREHYKICQQAMEDNCSICCHKQCGDYRSRVRELLSQRLQQQLH